MVDLVARRLVGVLALAAAFAAPAAAQDPTPADPKPADPKPAESAEEPPEPAPKPAARKWMVFGALGVSQRVDHGEGRTIPLLSFWYRHEDLLAPGIRLDAQYVTTWVSGELRGRFGPEGRQWPLYLGIGGASEIQSGLQTPYRYFRGDYLRRGVFYTTYADGSAYLGWAEEHPDNPFRLDVQLRYRYRRHWFEDAPDTAPTFKLPANGNEHRAELSAVIDGRKKIRNIEIQRGGGIWAAAGYAKRDRWRAWGDTPDTLFGDIRKAQEYTWGALALGWWQDWEPNGQHLHVELGGALADDLDRISGFALGSVYATFPYTWAITGYYYGELKADRLLLLNADYSFDINRNLRPYLYLDTGLVRQIGDRTRWQTGLGVGCRFGVPVGEQLLPITVRYGYAPRAKRGNKSRGGHELALRVLFAF